MHVDDEKMNAMQLKEERRTRCDTPKTSLAPIYDVIMHAGTPSVLTKIGLGLLLCLFYKAVVMLNAPNCLKDSEKALRLQFL